VVDLFGKKKLEDRILELESSLNDLQSDREELARTLEKRDEKIRKLNAANQECNLALKDAEQRAAAAATSSGLGEPDANAKRSESSPQARAVKTGPRELERLVKRLKECRTDEDDLLTAYLPDGKELVPEAREAAQAARSQRGWIVLKYPQLFTLLLRSAFPSPGEPLRPRRGLHTCAPSGDDGDAGAGRFRSRRRHIPGSGLWLRRF